MEDLRRWYKQIHKLLLQEFLDLAVGERDELMAEFEKGCDCIIFLVDVEFSVWLRLPLRVCALGHPEVDLARQALRICRVMFHELEPEVRAEARQLVLAMFTDKGDFFVQMNAFLDDDVPLRDLPALRRTSCKLRLVRCNEISVERLHALAIKEGKTMGNISPAAVSLTLREPCMWHRVCGFPMCDMASRAAKVRNDMLLISAFKFERHPTVTTYRDKLLARPARSRRGTIGVGRECFDHCDSFSTRSRHLVLEFAMTEHKARLTDLLQQRQTVHLVEQAMKKDAAEPLKVETLCIRYGFKHFKDKRLTCLVSA